MIELCTTSLKTPAEQDRIRRLIDDSSGALPSEHRHVFKNLSATYLLRTARIPNLETMPIEPFALLDHRERQLVYWNELDRLIQCIRGCVFQQVTSRIIVTLETTDAVTRAAGMRLAIELSIWASYFQYGLTTAHNVLQRELAGVDTDGVICEDLESYIRGALTVGHGRRIAAARALGYEPDPEHRTVDGAATVAEFDVIFRKQVDTVRAVAAGLPGQLGLAALTTAVDRLYSSYHFFCSLTHATPVLLMGAYEPDKSNDELAVYFVNAACISLLLLHELYFSPRFDALQFSPFLDRVAGNRPGVTAVALDFLQDMTLKNRPFGVELSDGVRRVFYPTDRKPK
jgi:hypothetical protein